MKILTTIHQTWSTEWRIRINPRKNVDGTEAERIVNFWEPPNRKGDGMLIYNPIVTINVRNSRVKDAPSINIPINKAYGLEDALSVVHNNLRVKGLFMNEGTKLYLDIKLAEQYSTKVNCFRDIVVFRPAVLYLPTGEDVKGIQIICNSQLIAEIRHDEIRELCEVLNHLDVQTYVLVASMLEGQYLLDKKLDRVLEQNSELLMLVNRLLKSQEVNKQTNPSDPFAWRRMT